MKRTFYVLALMIVFNVSIAFGQSQELSLFDIVGRGIFYPERVSGIRSMNDGENYTVIENNNKIVKHSYKKADKSSIILDLSKLKNSAVRYISDYNFNKDETKILISTNVRPIYRRSFLADYYIYDIANKELKSLSSKGSQQVATFSPDGARIAFVRDNNIFIHDMRFGSEIQITDDGKHNEIINGIPDWVYEEEFSFNKAFEWAPDGSSLAYIKFDESKVKEYSIQMFEGQSPDIRKNELYPSLYTYKYPKAGEKNSEVSVYVYDINDRMTTKINTGEEKDIYIPRIKWTKDPKHLAVMKLNRHQNKLDILNSNVRTGKSVIMYSEKNKYYIAESNFDNLRFLDNNKGFIFTSEKSGYMHIYKFDMNGKEIKKITEGMFDVADFYGYDSKGRYYYSSHEDSPTEKHIYYITERGTKKRISKEAGWHKADFSRNFKYFIHTYSNINTLPISEVANYKGKTIRTINDNARLKSRLANYNLPQKEFIQIPSADGKIMLNALLIKPSDFDTSKKYPLIINQYSGPNSQEVKNEWSIDWLDYMAQEGYIIATIDPRGTGGRGEQFRKCTYMNLGKIESDDLIAAAKWLGNSEYVQADKIGIWGWSYGGFMSSLCILKGNDVFNTAIAIAPVTNFKYYDSVYTERFMRTPQENKSGYEDNSPLNMAKNLKGNLLICHGTADDNVHIQNAYELSERLVQANKQFDMQIYLNRNHGIYGGYTRLQLFQKFVNYFNNKLK